ncbi:MAG TPA: hypothetical protein VGL70_14405 [Candidatus Binatia bacterium]|jgi:hypothetical protein
MAYRRALETDACRKKNDGDTWHFCSNCSNWPAKNYDEQTSPPMFGELCNECKAKRRDGTCS